MISLLRALLVDEGGATAIEYGLIVAMVSIVLIASLQSIGVTLNSVFYSAATPIGDVATDVRLDQ